MRTSDLVCQLWKSTSFLKLWHACGSVGCLSTGRICRSDVVSGSHGFLEGVIKALRFCIIESSIMPRDSRRKSRSAVWLKQNCGVRFGRPGGSDILFFEACLGKACPSGCFSLFAVDQKSPATLKKCPTAEIVEGTLIPGTFPAAGSPPTQLTVEPDMQKQRRITCALDIKISELCLRLCDDAAKPEG